MNIRDMENRVGMDRATIRYYEKEGLISPCRRENGYRDYTSKEQEELLKIKLLRQLGISLEQIKSLQQGSSELGETVTRQISLLSEEQVRLERCREVCCCIQKDSVSYRSINPEEYLNMLSGRSEPQNKPAVYFTEAKREPAHPFRRYAARMLDHLLLCVLVDVLIFVVFRFRGISLANMDTFSSIMGYICWWLQLPISAFLISKVGFTPGKWLFGMKLTSPLGRKLDFSEALGRENAVFFYGMGFGIPIYSLIRMYRCFREASRDEPMDWDDEAETEYKENIRVNIVLAAVMFVLCIGISFGATIDMLYPSNRNGIETVGEFAENFRDYQRVLGNVPGRDLMEKDGTFYVHPNTLYIGINGPTEPAQFVYETEAGKLKSIQYSSSIINWFETEKYAVPYDCVYAACAVIGGTKGTRVSDLEAIIKELQKDHSIGSYEYAYENIKLKWFFSELVQQEEEDNTVDFRFQIILG